MEKKTLDDALKAEMLTVIKEAKQTSKVLGCQRRTRRMQDSKPFSGACQERFEPEVTKPSGLQALPKQLRSS